VVHTEHALAAHALYKCAFILDIDIGRKDEAQKVYQYIIDRYPDSEWSTKSAQGIAKLLGSIDDTNTL